MQTSLPSSPEPHIKTFVRVFENGVPIVVMRFGPQDVIDGLYSSLLHSACKMQFGKGFFS
jgi:hypothetical protein